MVPSGVAILAWKPHRNYEASTAAAVATCFLLLLRHVHAWLAASARVEVRHASWRPTTGTWCAASGEREAHGGVGVAGAMIAVLRWKRRMWGRELGAAPDYSTVPSQGAGAGESKKKEPPLSTRRRV